MNLTDTTLLSFVPRLGKVRLRFTFPKTWNQRELLDVTGREVYSKAGLEIKAFQLPFEGLSNGTYLLQVQNGSGEIFSSKLLRQ